MGQGRRTIRGLEVNDDDADRLAAAVGPILERFQELARELTADDDLYEFRRLLAQEGLREYDRIASVAEIAGTVRAGDGSSRGTIEHFLARAQAADAALNCFIELDGEAAIHRATALDRKLGEGDDAGPLVGVPFAAKDIFTTGERRPSNGSRRVRLASGARSSTALERLTAAGAIQLGWLNLDQFSYAATGTNPDFGSVRNPWDLTRMTGGSSSGAAAAVAAGAAAFAIGGDTGGSVRIPASFCGVVGLKPTFGRIPRRRSAPMCYSQDSLGLIARSVADAALVLEAAAGHDPLDPSSFDVGVPSYSTRLGDGAEGLRGIRVGFDRSYVAALAGDEVQAATEAAVALMAEHGAELVELDLRRLTAYDLAATVITWAEVGGLHAQTFPSDARTMPRPRRRGSTTRCCRTAQTT